MFVSFTDHHGRAHVVDLSTVQWITASNSGDCVQVGQLAEGHVALRDSKHPDQRPLIFTPEEWDTFLSGAKGGQFDI